MRFVPRLRDWPWALKLFGLLLTTAIVPVCALTLYSDIVVRRESVQAEGARNLQRARNTAVVIDQYLQDLLADVSIIALASPTREVLGGGSDPGQLAELTELLTHVTAAKNLPLLSVLDTTGLVVAATDQRFVGANRGSTPFFLSAIAGESRIHEPRYIPQDRAINMHASVPVFDAAGRIVGVVAARIPLAEMDRLIAADTNYGSDGEFGLLWDQHGIVLSSPASPGRRLRPLGTLPGNVRSALEIEGRYGPDTARLLTSGGTADAFVQRARAVGDAPTDPIQRADLGDGALQIASVAIPNQRWTYSIASLESEVLVEAREQSRRNLLAALLTALAAIGLAIVCASWLVRPLDKVRATAQALAEGDMHRRTRLDRRDEIGQMALAFDSMADALARKDAELRMHADSLERHVSERTAELSGLLAAIPDLIFKVGRDGRVLDYSAPAEELALPPESFLGRRLTDVLPPDVSLPAEALVERVLAGEVVPPFEYQLMIRGQVQHYEARGCAAGGESVLFLVRNVTERRHHEERMRFLARAGTALTASLDYGNIVETLAQLPVPFMADICVVDVAEDDAVRCAAVSARTPELQAFMRAERLENPVDLSSDHPVAVALTKGMAHFQGSAVADDAMTSVLEIESMIVVPLIARGQTLGAMSFLTVDGRRYFESDFAVAQELTHRAGIALDNARLYRDAQEASRLKDEFLGIVSHELRTPLNAVLGWSQVLRRSRVDPDQLRRAVLAIERNAQAQARLVEDLLDTSRVISGKIRLQPATVDLRKLIRGTVESFGPMARSAGLEVTASVSEDVGEIRADPARLQQILGNLLSNSLKFTPAGGRIAVDVHRHASTIEIRVSDTGAGITSEFLPHVFERFRQADSTTTRAHGGLGLGLAIARHLVELHGGAISASSAGAGLGSSFTIVLPAGSPANVEERRPSPVKRQELSRLFGARVLAVDDSEEALELVRTMLSAAGAVVSVAKSVDEARKIIEEMPPDILVGDIGMPAQDGHALIRIVRAREAQTGAPRLPAVALTAYARGEDRIRSAAAGYDVHLTKPIDAAILVDTLTSLLERVSPRSAGEVAT